MDKLTIQEFGATIKQKYPQYSTLSDYEIGQKTLSKYPQYSEKVTHTFDVPEVPKQRPNLQQLQSEAQQAQVQSKKANSIGGFLGNFGKAVVENIAPSEVGLGKTIGKLAGNQTNTYSKLIGDVNTQQVNLLKAIKEKETKGGDTTSLKRIYNDNVNQLRELNKNLTEESNLPSTSKVVGQLGGTALDILTAGAGSKALKSGKLATKSPLIQKVATATGLPELGKIATQKAGGLATVQGLKNIGTGAGIGYASDITMGLQGLRGEDREGVKSLIPGLGTAIGTSIPVASESVQTYKNLTDPNIKVQKLIDKRTKALDRLDKYQTLKKATEKGSQRGINIKKLLAETDVLAGTVDNTGTIVTKGEDGPIAQYTKQYIDGNENIVSELLKKEGRAVSPALVKARLIQKVKNAGIEGKNLTSALKSIDDEVAGYMLRTNEQGNIPTWIIHDAKIDKYNGINFFTEGATKKYDKTIAKALKEIIEETTTSADIKKVNEELSKHFAVIDYLNKLDNKKVDGGKLGKYFAQTVGAIVGSNFGPLGAIAGAEAGGMVKGNLMQRSFGGTTGKIPQQAEVITEALKVKNAPPLELPQSKSKSLGNLKTNQTTTMMKTKNSNIPKSSTKSATKSIDEEMVTVYHASPKMPKTGNWRKDTYFASTSDEANYYASSHHNGKIDIQKVEIPKRLLHKNNTNNIYQLKEEYPIKNSVSKSIDLTSEAKKYKSAEDFVKAETSQVPFYSGTIAERPISSKGIVNLTSNRNIAESYATKGGVVSSNVGKKAGINLVPDNMLSPEIRSKIELTGSNQRLSGKWEVAKNPVIEEVTFRGNPKILDLTETKLNGGLEDFTHQLTAITKDTSIPIKERKVIGDIVRDINKKGEFDWSFTKGYGEELSSQKVLIDRVYPYLKKQGYDGITYKDYTANADDFTTSIWSQDKIITKSQLTDIWKKANN